MQEQHSQLGNQEKRAGRDRRSSNGQSVRTSPERRCMADRRQTSISEITYFEWASHFVRFHEMNQPT